MITVTFYYTEDCEFCKDALSFLTDLQSEIPHKLIKINIQNDHLIKERYGNQVPVIQAGPYRLKKSFSKQDVLVALKSAQEREDHLSGVDGKAYQKHLDRKYKYSSSDRISAWLSDHYMALFNTLMALYVGLAVLAPVLMKTGLVGPAKVIYTVYSPLCHQLPFRSFFLFGQQAYYPREIAGLSVEITIEDIIHDHDGLDLITVRKYIGDDFHGYKIALCERCLAIYSAFLLFGLVFVVFGRKIKPIPWYIWIFFGVAPMGLDGVSQLPSLVQNLLPKWMLIRESTPLLRVLTGGLFGITTAWYLYPYIEESMRDTRTILARKRAVSEQIENDELSEVIENAISSD